MRRMPAQHTRPSARPCINPEGGATTPPVTRGTRRQPRNRTYASSGHKGAELTSAIVPRTRR
eukprot:7474013-Alexandrium_andersonii.AAC.1